MAAKKKNKSSSNEVAQKAQVISDQAVQIAGYAAQALVTAEELRIKTRPLEQFRLEPEQQDVLLAVPDLSKSIKNKLVKGDASFTVKEVASMTMAVAEALPDAEARRQIEILHLAKHLMDQLQQGITGLAEAKMNEQ